MPEGEVHDLVALRDFLEEADATLANHGRRLLVALDEYEYFDRKLGEGVFDEDLLALFRFIVPSLSLG